jgi:hypothetical protein
MNDPTPGPDELNEQATSVHDLLLRLDLAVEVLEGLDQLGVDNRVELEALLQRLERQISESS